APGSVVELVEAGEDRDRRLVATGSARDDGERLVVGGEGGPGRVVEVVGQSSTSPTTAVTVPPPIQMVPSSSWVTLTRPARPRTMPGRAAYGAFSRPEPRSHCAREALRLPVTGSSTAMPSLGKKARTSMASGPPAGCKATTPIMTSIRPGRRARTC